jgi:hypothetical protein
MNFMSLRLNYSLVEKVFWPDEESRTSCYRTDVVYEIFAVTRHCSANPRDEVRLSHCEKLDGNLHGKSRDCRNEPGSFCN